MNLSYSNMYMNLDDYEDYQNSQYYQNSHFFSNPSQVSCSQNPQTSQNTEKQPRTIKWDVVEDVVLISAWCMISGDSICGKNQKKHHCGQK